MSHHPDLSSRRRDATDGHVRRFLRDTVIGAVMALHMIAVVATTMLVIDPLPTLEPMLLSLILATLWAMAIVFGLLVRSHTRRQREAGLATNRLALWWDNVAGLRAVRLLPPVAALAIIGATTGYGLPTAAAYIAAILAALVAFLAIDQRDQPPRAATRRHGAATIAMAWLLAAVAVAAATGAVLVMLVAAGAATASVISSVWSQATWREPHQRTT